MGTKIISIGMLQKYYWKNHLAYLYFLKVVFTLLRRSAFLRNEWLLLAATIIIGFVAAFIPAFRASRTDISDTLTGT